MWSGNFSFKIKYVNIFNGRYYNMKPEWGSRHDEVVARFEAKEKTGKVKEFVFVTRD